MRLYACQYCSHTLFFENARCGHCHSQLGYWAETDSLCVLEPVRDDPGLYTSFAVPGHTLRPCANTEFDVCNWMVDAESGEAMCTACRHNGIVPAFDNAHGMLAWPKIESAKHKLFASLHRLDLVRVIERAGVDSLAFNFLDDWPDGSPVMTGHAGGLVTISTKEADDSERERRRQLMGEPYRTLLGHFRHESGHYFWDRLVRDTDRLDECRAVFGDHTPDYGAAMRRYYAEGAPADWPKTFVSAYATMHPWEDFSETWAHYLHMVATLDTAYTCQLQMAPRVDKLGTSRIERSVDPYATRDIDELIAIWLPLTTALNALNSAMGKDDAYPFTLTPPVIEKLGFIHRLIREAPRSGAGEGTPLAA